MAKFVINMPPMPEEDVKRNWAQVLKTSRSAGDPTLKMERAYVDKQSGKVSCCWSADNGQKVEALFKQAGVPFESISEVEEAVEADFA